MDMPTSRSNNLPALTYAERLLRAESKRKQVKTFLASGEVWGSTATLSMLLNLGWKQTERTLQAMVVDGDLAEDRLFVKGRPVHLWGLTSHALATSNAHELPSFRPGRQNSEFVEHHLLTQQLHIRTLGVPGLEFIPGKVIQSRIARASGQDADGQIERLSKIPDAMLLRLTPRGTLVRYALEMEKTIKRDSAYVDAFMRHLSDFGTIRLDEVAWREQRRSHEEAHAKNGICFGVHYDIVHYIQPSDHVAALEAIFGRINVLKGGGIHRKVCDFDRARIRFFSLTSWFDWLASIAPSPVEVVKGL